MIEERDGELERELAKRFGELRGRRERAARSYTVGVAVARGRIRDRARGIWLKKRLTVALATALPLVTVLVAQRREQAREREAAELAREAASMLAWQSPTATLLNNAYADWLGTTPSLSASIVDPTPLPTGGSQ